MKKYFLILIFLFLTSELFAKQYLYKISTKDRIPSVIGSLIMKEDLDKVLFDLILKGFEIVQIVPTLADGYTVGYTLSGNWSSRSVPVRSGADVGAACRFGTHRATSPLCRQTA